MKTMMKTCIAARVLPKSWDQARSAAFLGGAGPWFLAPFDLYFDILIYAVNSLNDDIDKKLDPGSWHLLDGQCHRLPIDCDKPGRLTITVLLFLFVK